MARVRLGICVVGMLGWGACISEGGGSSSSAKMDVMVSADVNEPSARDEGQSPPTDVAFSYDPAPSDSGGWYYADATSDSGWWGSDAPASDYGPGNPGGDTSACTPNCDGRQCGPDGCGGSCGWCPGTLSCQSGSCKDIPGCTPECSGHMTGQDDGCGGVCCGSGTGIGLKPGGAQDASYFRRLVREGKVPDPGFLPVEGWLNEHDTPLPEPDTSLLMTLHGFAGVMMDPAEDAPLVTLQLGMNSGLDPRKVEEARFNLAIVVDRSGSMGGEGKLEAVKAGLLMMLDQLDERDRLAIVRYDSIAEVVVPSAPVKDKAALRSIISSLYAGSSTNLYDGLMLGYGQVEGQMDGMPDAQHRVILLSDGMANEGPVTDNAGIIAASKPYNLKGIGLTTIGVGTSFNYDLMYQLANQGNGNFYFVDTPAKLLEVFVEEIKYLLTPVAENLQIWFRLSAGLGVEAIYGFEFTHTGDDWVVLGPQAQYDVTPPEEKPPAGPGGNVAVSTVFASKKNGIVMVRLSVPGVDQLVGLQNGSFARIAYRYTRVAEQKEETNEIDVPLGGFTFHDGPGDFEFFSDDIVRRNFCLLRMALSMRRACQDFHDGIATSLDVQRLQHTAFFCQTVSADLAGKGWDPVWLDPLVEDIEVMAQLQHNLEAQGVSGDTGPVDDSAPSADVLGSDVPLADSMLPDVVAAE